MKFTLIEDPTKEEEVVATVHRPSPFTDRLEELVRRHTGTDTLPVYDEDELLLLPFGQIECITVEQGKTYAIDCGGLRHRVRMRLYEVEALLPAGFFRINKSAIANQCGLLRFSAGYSGAVEAVFKCGWRDYVSRRCFAQIKRRFLAK